MTVTQENINQMTFREKVIYGMDQFKEMDIYEFSIQDMCEILGLDCYQGSSDYRNINSTLWRMVNDGEVIKLKRTKKRKEGVRGSRGQNLYTWDTNRIEMRQEPEYPHQGELKDQKPSQEQKLTLLEIGDAIMTKMVGLQETINELSQVIDAQSISIEEKKDTIKQQNELICKLNEELEKVKKDQEKRTHSQEAFKLSEIATFK